MRGIGWAVGAFVFMTALACGGEAPVAAPSAAVRVEAAPAARAVAPAAPAAPEGKTVVDAGRHGMTITTKQGTEIDLQNGGLLGGGLSIQGAKTDLKIGRVKEVDTDAPEKKKIFGK